jgi:major type 1 subunit fimbrin (pilin)
MKTASFFSTAATAVSLLTIAPLAHAADGTIEFTGMVTALTCEINGGGANNDFTVALPPVPQSSLSAIGSSAGRTPFAITLTNCSPDSGMVSTYFEPGATVDLQTNQLKVDLGGAQNVELRLLNSDFSKVLAGAAKDSQNSTPVSIDSGAATMNYYVEYAQYGVAGATPGQANSRIQYTLTYQ